VFTYIEPWNIYYGIGLLQQHGQVREKISERLRVVADFTQILWVRKQFIFKLAIDPFPEH